MERVTVNEAQCVGCGQCTLVCEVDALSSQWGEMSVDGDLCVLCGVCVDCCPVDALSIQEP
ncbi:4Fe-4S binding protein [Thermodesulfobacteriota bacterium]